jgi:nitrogen-specific signal transduction histidine kinase
MKGTSDVKFMVGDVTGIVSLENNTGGSDSAVGSNSNVAGSHGIIFDITKYKQAEKERMELQKRFFEIQKIDAVGRLAGKVAHDLNNKLGSILGCAEMLRMDFSDGSDEDKYVDTIISASKHAAELSFRLKCFSRRDDQESNLISLHQLLENVLALVQPSLDTIVVVDKNFNASENCVIGNYNQLQNAILNIINNACEAMGKRGGTVIVTTTNTTLDQTTADALYFAKPGRYVLISIADSGPGINESTRKKLFQPFFTTKEEGMGIGLGLISVRDCLKEHGGFIDIQNSIGHGADIKLYIPVAETDSELPPA